MAFIKICYTFKNALNVNLRVKETFKTLIKLFFGTHSYTQTQVTLHKKV